MMINGVCFTGRETMLTKGLKSAGENGAAKTYEYLSAGKVFKNAPKETSTKIAYSSPFEPVDGLNHEPDEDVFLKVLKSPTPEQEVEMSYAISHGTPEDIASKLICKVFDFFG